METKDASFLRAAILGYEQTIQNAANRVNELRRELAAIDPEFQLTLGALRLSPREAARHEPKHRISAAGKAKIAAATRKRWAAYRAEKAAQSKAAVQNIRKTNRRRG